MYDIRSFKERITKVHEKDIKISFDLKRNHHFERDNVVETKNTDAKWKKKEDSKWITIVKECTKRGKYSLKKKTRK